jgi:methoxymalonate biosynthesis acyl carrier protein
MGNIEMNRDELSAIVVSFLVNEKSDVVPDEDSNLFEQGLLNSLQIISLVVFLEEKLGLSFDFNDLTEENLKAVRTIVDLIMKHQVREEAR